MKRRTIYLMMCICMMVSPVTTAPFAFAANSLTMEQVQNWLDNEINAKQTRGSGECVDFCNYYLANCWGLSTIGGNAGTWKDKCPDGWTSIDLNGSFDNCQIGDLLVEDYSPYGHVSVYYGKEDGKHYVVDQNNQGRRYTDKGRLWADFSNPMYCFRYMGWTDQESPEIISDKVSATEISIDGFTLDFQATDNVGIVSAYALVCGAVEPDSPARINGTYNKETSSVIIPVNIADVGVICELYTFRCYVSDAAGNTVCVSSSEPVSIYIVDSSVRGTYRAVRDTSIRFAPRESFNGYSTAAYTLKQGETVEVIGSINAGGTTYYRLDSVRWVCADDVEYYGVLSVLSDIWNAIAGTVSKYCYFGFNNTASAIGSPNAPESIGFKLHVPVNYSLQSDEARTLIDTSMMFIPQEKSDYAIRLASENDETVVYIAEYYGSGGDVTIPETVGGYKVVGIDSSAFDNSNSVTSVTLPECVTKLGYAAFCSCDNLSSVVLPLSEYDLEEESIYVWPFMHCPKLTDITIPVDLKTANLTGDNVPIERIHYAKGQTGIMPDHSKGSLNTDSIEAKAYSTLKSIDFEDGVLRIGSAAFHNCYSLESVSLPSTLESIGDSAFRSTTSLKSISLPESVTEIGEYCFEDSGLETVTINEGITHIPQYCFAGCSQLNHITLPKSLCSIGESAFSWCISITELPFYNDNWSVELGENSFKNCTGLTSLHIPSTITSIGSGAFSCCTNVEDLILAEGTTKLGYAAFSSCNNLSSVVLPLSEYDLEEESIYVWPFMHCPKLTDITIPVDLKTANLTGDNVPIERIHYTKGQTGIMPDHSKGSLNTDSIEAKAYSTLKSIDFEDGVLSIGSGAYYDCSLLTTISFPSSLTSIGNSSFDGCADLKDIYYSGNEASWVRIAKGADNDPLNSATMHYSSDPQPDATFFTGNTYTEDTYEGDFYSVGIYCALNEDALSISARYDADGQMFDVSMATLASGQDNTVVIPVGKSEHIYIFVVDKESFAPVIAPLCLWRH